MPDNGSSFAVFFGSGNLNGVDAATQVDGGRKFSLFIYHYILSIHRETGFFLGFSLDSSSGRGNQIAFSRSKNLEVWRLKDASDLPD